jgi:hypothetical protein
MELSRKKGNNLRLRKNQVERKRKQIDVRERDNSRGVGNKIN